MLINGLQHPNQIAGVIATARGLFSAAVGTEPEASNDKSVPPASVAHRSRETVGPLLKHPVAEPMALKKPAPVAGLATPVMFLIASVVIIPGTLLLGRKNGP